MDKGLQAADNTATYIISKGVTAVEKRKFRNSFMTTARNNLELLFPKHHVFVRKATKRHQGKESYFIRVLYYSNLVVEGTPVEILVFETGHYTFDKCCNEEYILWTQGLHVYKERIDKKVRFDARRNDFKYSDEQQKIIDDNIEGMGYRLCKATEQINIIR